MKSLLLQLFFERQPTACWNSRFHAYFNYKLSKCWWMCLLMHCITPHSRQWYSQSQASWRQITLNLCHIPPIKDNRGALDYVIIKLVGVKCLVIESFLIRNSFKTSIAFLLLICSLYWFVIVNYITATTIWHRCASRTSRFTNKKPREMRVDCGAASDFYWKIDCLTQINNKNASKSKSWRAESWDVFLKSSRCNYVKTSSVRFGLNSETFVITTWVAVRRAFPWRFVKDRSENMLKAIKWHVKSFWMLSFSVSFIIMVRQKRFSSEISAQVWILGESASFLAAILKWVSFACLLTKNIFS